MCRKQCVLALAALYVGLVHSWDIAVSLGDELVFYTNGSKTDTVNLLFHNLVALAYDDVHDIMFYVNKQSDNDAICGYNLHSKEDKCFIKRNNSNIHSIAFDPVTDTLFFTDTNERSINWISLKPESINNVYGNLITKMDDRTPSDIAVDSSRGYIYWINTHAAKNDQYMERARFNGSEREVMDLRYQYLELLNLAIDPQTRKINYFVETRLLMSRDLDQYEDDRITYDKQESGSEIKALTVSNDYIYWISGNVNNQTVWQIPKNANEDTVPKKINTSCSKSPHGIAANPKLKNKIQGFKESETLSSLIPTITVTDTQQTGETEQKTECTTVAELFCVHGIKVSETSVCKCTPGYIGERCDVSVCENYCLQGDCSFNDDGLPKCRCNAGYSGERCEVNLCHGYCSNNGTCSLNEGEPICQCIGDYAGDRCQVSDCLNYCIQGDCSFNDEGLPQCRCNAGYSGERCEVYACHGYCLNNGDCSLNEEDEPVCQCVGNHEGTRCEAVTDVAFTVSNTPTNHRNLTLADLLSNWRKLTATFVIEK